MDKRTFLAIVLSMAVIFVYQTFFAKPPAQKQPSPQKTEQAAPTAQKDEATKEAAVASVDPPATPSKKILPENKTIPEKNISVETPLYSAVFTNEGAALKSLKLKDYYSTLPPDRRYSFSAVAEIFQSNKSEKKPAQLVELVNVKEGMPKPLTVSFPNSTVNIPLRDHYETRADRIDLTKSSDKYRLTFSRTYPGNMKVEKTYTFYPDKYNIDLEVRAYNLSSSALTQNPELIWTQFHDPKEESSDGHVGPITYIADKVNRIEPKEIEKAEVIGPGVSWDGFESKYFIAALIPQNPSLTSAVIGKNATDMMSAGLEGPKSIIPPGQAGFYSYTLFLGPKNYTVLKSQGVGLENAVDFNSWIPGLKWLTKYLLLGLKFIHKYVGNYGIAIIIITILIKILFWPLGNISYKSMKEMQKLQPKIAELREKYKDDRNKIGQETMALYRAHKVNPLSGCLPMLIQIPVFFGFYNVLLYSIELRHSPFFWWIQDLSDKDPFYITPIIMGATMFIQQKMSPPMGDPMQAKLMLWMPVIFTFMFLNFASGLVIYWLFNNIISIGQQYYITRRSSTR